MVALVVIETLASVSADGSRDADCHVDRSTRPFKSTLVALSAATSSIFSLYCVHSTTTLTEEEPSSCEVNRGAVVGLTLTWNDSALNLEM